MNYKKEDGSYEVLYPQTDYDGIIGSGDYLGNRIKIMESESYVIQIETNQAGPFAYAQNPIYYYVKNFDMLVFKLNIKEVPWYASQGLLTLSDWKFLFQRYCEKGYDEEVIFYFFILTKYAGYNTQSNEFAYEYNKWAILKDTYNFYYTLYGPNSNTLTKIQAIPQKTDRSITDQLSIWLEMTPNMYSPWDVELTIYCCNFEL